jgi:hypothetical protein
MQFIWNYASPSSDAYGTLQTFGTNNPFIINGSKISLENGKAC